MQKNRDEDQPSDTGEEGGASGDVFDALLRPQTTGREADPSGVQTINPDGEISKGRLGFPQYRF